MKTRVLVVVGAVLVVVPLLLFRVFVRLGSDEAKPRYTRADLTPLPADDVNLYVALMKVAKSTARPTFDRGVLDSKSWDELKERHENGLNLDFKREEWAQSEALDDVLKPTGSFVETCEPGTPCELMPVLWSSDLLMARVLALANKGELDAAELLVFRLRAAFIDWEKAPRTLLGMVMVHMLQREVEKLLNLLAVDDSPMREVIKKHVELCEPLVVSRHRDPLVFEAASFHEMAAAVKGRESSYWLFDRRESQEMVDACVDALLANADATCSYGGLDGQPEWFHNKVGRPLAGSINVAMSNVMNKLRGDETELVDAQQRAWCAGK
ncbi:MAG: hypothetical protein ACO1OB_24315 [Archangium sp.]